MSNYGYDKDHAVGEDGLTLLAGTPRSRLNANDYKTTAAIENEANYFELRSSTNPYKVGDLVIKGGTGNGLADGIKDNKLYRCKFSHYGAWNDGNFEITNLATENAKKIDITTLKTIVSDSTDFADFKVRIAAL